MSEERTINDAKTGDVVTLYGTRWTVIGFIDRPSALLEREDVFDMPLNQRTHHAVTLGTDHARQFKLEDPVEELIQSFWRSRGEGDGCDLIDMARWLFASGKIDRRTPSIVKEQIPPHSAE